jgi:hypothetical protein
MSYIGAEPNGMGKAERFTFTASGSETTVSVDDAGVPISYTENQVSVYLNGVKLVVGTGKDCQATNGSTITGLSALSANDVIEVVALSIFSATTVEGTALISTGQTGGTKFLREDGDGTASWQTATDATKAPLATPTFTGEVTAPSLILTPRTVPTSPAPVEGQVYYNNANNVIYMYTGAEWLQLTNVPFSATGGNSIVTSGAFKVHVFTASGAFTPNADVTVDYLVVAGGGGGGGTYSSPGGGGGGAGGFRTGASLDLTAQEYTITVGLGGTGGTASNAAQGTSGGNSIFSTITSYGGGAGGHYNTKPGLSGGSGGGGILGYGAGAGNTPSTSPVQGYAGGVGGTNQAAGGGGGAAGVGGAAVSGGNPSAGGGGAGGAGEDQVMGLSASDSYTLLTDASVGHVVSGARYFSGGGGGGKGYDSGGSTFAGLGGNGGGGAGTVGASSNPGPTGTAGTANTGGGGGGSGSKIDPQQSVGGAGGSGIVIIRYAI